MSGMRWPDTETSVQLMYIEINTSSNARAVPIRKELI